MVVEYVLKQRCKVRSGTARDGSNMQGYSDTGVPGGSDGKASACNEGDLDSIPGSGRSPEEGNGTPLQYSCLENPMDRGAWWATVHGVAKSQTRLSDFTFTIVHTEDAERDSSGGPGTKTLCSRCREPRFKPRSGNLDPTCHN